MVSDETLYLENIGKHFAGKQVVKNISLNIPQGGFVALLGASGCGKTTILRLIAGLERLDAGSIHQGARVFDNSQTHMAPEHRQLGMVFQAYALWPHFNVYENVAYPLKIHGIKGARARQQVMAMLEQVGLADFANREVAALSGGQQQRVALARSLVTKPKIILLDEPLANLDRHLRASMQSTFKTLNRESGSTFIYVTHDQNEAMNLANAIAVLKDGSLCQYASAEDLYQKPQNAFTAAFIGEGSLLKVQSDQSGVHLYAQNAQACWQNPGTKCALLRPQHVKITPQANAHARVVGCEFLGERYLVALKLPTGQSLSAYHPHFLAINTTVLVEVQQLWLIPA